jgi:CRP-like cAMP-binding protein
MSSTGSPEHQKLIRQLEGVVQLSSEDRAALAALPLRLKSVSEKRDIIREGSRPVESCLVLEGVVCRYKMLSSGRRQIVSFHYPGDMPDLQSIYLKTMDHSLASVTAARVAFVPHDSMRAIIRARPDIADALLRHTLIDSSIYREWIVSIGRRSSLERVAHMICECFVRMRALGLAKQADFELPLAQAELCDSTGLSLVHVNRTLKELRRLELIRTIAKVHSIRDWDMLQEAADFDPGYLHLKRLAPS